MFSVDRMAEFSHEELQTVVLRYHSEFERVKKVGLDFKSQLKQKEQQLAGVNGELNNLREIESLLREEVQSLK